jgi:hypothetical protein
MSNMDFFIFDTDQAQIYSLRLEVKSKKKTLFLLALEPAPSHIS